MSDIKLDDELKLERNLTKAEALLVFEWLSELSDNEKLEKTIGDYAT